MTLVGVINNYLLSIPWWIVVIVIFITFMYQYLTWNFGYWESKGIKGPKPRIMMGTFEPLSKKMPLEVQDQNNYQKYGPIFGTFEGRRPVLNVADPELLRTVLVKDFHAFQNRRDFMIPEENDLSKMLSLMRGEEWKTLRNMMTPAFTTGKMKQMIEFIGECAKQLVNHLEKFEEKDEAFEARQWFGSFTMDVIATCAFGTKIDSVHEHDSEFVQNASKVFQSPPPWFVIFLMLPEKCLKPLFRMIPNKPMDFMSNFVEKVIETRKLENNKRRDFLQLLLEAKDEYEKELQDDEEQNKKDKAAFRKNVLTQGHIRAQVILFLLAGFETSSITLSFVLYFLALNPSIQDKLIKEVDEIVKQKYNNMITYDTLSDMQYMDMVFSETLRICPTAIRMERVCGEDNYQLGDVKLTKELLVNIPVYVLHHDEKFYPNPKVFDPERFSVENRNTRDPYTYLPFGQGPRNCIGMRFALMQMKIGLIHLLREFRIKTCDETEIPFKRKPNSVFFLPESIKLKVEKRNS